MGQVQEVPCPAGARLGQVDCEGLRRPAGQPAQRVLRHQDQRCGGSIRGAGDLQREGDRRVGVQAVQGAQRRSPPHGHGSVVQGKDPAASAGAGSKDDGDGQAAGQGQQPEGKAPRGLAGEGHVDPQEAPGLAACRPRSLADKGAPQVNQGAPAGPGSGPAWEDPEKLETRIPKV